MNQIDEKDDDIHEKFSIQAYQGLKNPSEHPRLKLSMIAQKIKLKEKMSTIMIINEGKPVSLEKVASDLQVTSLNEIFSYLSKQNNGGKLSSLAKDLGFQLLSDDIDVKPVNVQQYHTEVQFNPITAETSQVSQTDIPNMDDDTNRLGKSAREPEENSKLTELSSQNDELKTICTDPSKEIKSLEPEKSVADHEPHVTEDMKAETEGSSDGDKSVKESVADHELPFAKNMEAETDDSSDGDKSGKGSIADLELSVAKNMKEEKEGSSDGDKFWEEQDHFLGFNGSFYYSDGNYQLLQTLTGNCRVPTLVIVDPIRQQHYVFPEDKNLTFSSLYEFLSGFLNETLLPYQRSQHVLQVSKEAIRPPFVNLDFHEVDSIPRLTAHTFSEIVIGFNISDKENAWYKDVLVLFSYSWCGYCQRMEMVVREVYRAFKGYMDMLKSGSRNAEPVSGQGKIVRVCACHLIDVRY